MTQAEGFAPLWRVAVQGRCPRCGEGRLFAGFLRVAQRCNVCAQEFSQADSGDGPAVFVILIVGAVTAFTTLWLELTYRPPYWVHAFVAGTLIVGLSLLLLRPLKAFMIAQQIRHKAGEGRLEE